MEPQKLLDALDVLDQAHAPIEEGEESICAVAAWLKPEDPTEAEATARAVIGRLRTLRQRVLEKVEPVGRDGGD